MNPLSDPALKRIQADVDTMGELFVDTVAGNSNMKVAKVRDTQAATYMGAKRRRNRFRRCRHGLRMKHSADCSKN